LLKSDNVNYHETVINTDLGGSSKYYNEIFIGSKLDKGSIKILIIYWLVVPKLCTENVH